MRGVAATAALVLAAACTDRASSEDAGLPAAPTRMIAIGDPAGPAGRAAEEIANPFAGDAVARGEGARLFREMNCMYCHGASGEGGMGPNLVDTEWLFGDTPADRFMSVYFGRARGMPAYGRLLPDESVWKLVAHIEHMREKSGAPGRAGGDAAPDTRRAQSPTGRSK